MADVLDLYTEPDEPKRPKVNCDETSKPLIREAREPLPAAPGRPARYDYEYERNGPRHLLMFIEPPAGWRHMTVTERRTRQDVAHQRPWLVDEGYPEATVIRVVMDHLNTHTPASLYETFPPAEARRLLKKREFHDTPKHGSWLNMAEIELSILSRQCLARRIPDDAMLRREITAYEDTRHAAKATMTWRFTTTDARANLHHLYPSTSK
jgi:hypothetical protein